MEHPDPVGAGADLQLSFTYITAAFAELPQLPDPKLGRQTARRLECLDKNAGKAFDAIGDGNFERSIGKIGAGLRCGGEALVGLRGFRVEF